MGFITLKVGVNLPQRIFSFFFCIGKEYFEILKAAFSFLSIPLMPKLLDEETKKYEEGGHVSSVCRCEVKNNFMGLKMLKLYKWTKKVKYVL